MRATQVRELESVVDHMHRREEAFRQRIQVRPQRQRPPIVPLVVGAVGLWHVRPRLRVESLVASGATRSRRRAGPGEEEGCEEAHPRTGGREQHAAGPPRGALEPSSTRRWTSKLCSAHVFCHSCRKRLLVLSTGTEHSECSASICGHAKRCSRPLMSFAGSAQPR